MSIKRWFFSPNKSLAQPNLSIMLSSYDALLPNWNTASKIDPTRRIRPGGASGRRQGSPIPAGSTRTSGPPPWA